MHCQRRQWWFATINSVHAHACTYPTGAEEAGEEREYVVKFGQIYLSTPVVAETDGDTKTLYPREARLRNLT